MEVEEDCVALTVEDGDSKLEGDCVSAEDIVLESVGASVEDGCRTCHRLCSGGRQR